MLQQIFKYALVLPLALYVALSQASTSIKDDGKGNVIYKNGPVFKKYKNILGMYEGVYRELSEAKGFSDFAIFTGSKNVILFTLKKVKSDLYVDCILADDRSQINGVRIKHIVCGIDKPLTSSYRNLANRYLEKWMMSIGAIDVNGTPKGSYYLDISLGKIKDIEVHDRYQTSDDLAGAVPLTYFKSSNQCYSFPSGEVFVVYRKENLNEIDSIFLRGVQNRNWIFKHYSYKELKAFKYTKCLE